MEAESNGAKRRQRDLRPTGHPPRLVRNEGRPKGVGLRGRWKRPLSRSASTKSGLPRQHRGVQIVLSAGEVQVDGAMSKESNSRKRVFFTKFTISHPRTPSNLSESAKEIRKKQTFAPFFHCKRNPAYFVDLWKMKNATKTILIPYKREFSWVSFGRRLPLIQVRKTHKLSTFVGLCTL